MKTTAAAIMIIAALTAGCGTDHGSAVREEIGSAMRQQVDSWNSGELAGFMKYYWRSGEMTFHIQRRMIP